MVQPRLRQCLATVLVIALLAVQYIRCERAGYRDDGPDNRMAGQAGRAAPDDDDRLIGAATGGIILLTVVLLNVG